jgi:hypothetical protein
MTQECNSFGLFDAPVRSSSKDHIVLSHEDIERLLDAGAFMMDREEAIAAGFIDPQDEPDTVIVAIQQEEA